MLNNKGITQDQQSALKLFNFKASKRLSSRFLKKYIYSEHKAVLSNIN